ASRTKSNHATLNPCHPVSNDECPCQGVFDDTSPLASLYLKEAPFCSSRKGFCVFNQGSCSLNPAVDARSHHPSLRSWLPQLLLRTPRSFGEAGCLLKRSVLACLHRM